MRILVLQLRRYEACSLPPDGSHAYDLPGFPCSFSQWGSGLRFGTPVGVAAGSMCIEATLWSQFSGRRDRKTEKTDVGFEGGKAAYADCQSSWYSFTINRTRINLQSCNLSKLRVHTITAQFQVYKYNMQIPKGVDGSRCQGEEHA